MTLVVRLVPNIPRLVPGIPWLPLSRVIHGASRHGDEAICLLP